MIRPAAVESLDTMLRTSQGNLRISRIVVTAKGPQIGKSLSASGLVRDDCLLVLGLKEPTEDLVFNPSPSAVLSHGTQLIVRGEDADIARARQDF